MKLAGIYVAVDITRYGSLYEANRRLRYRKEQAPERLKALETEIGIRLFQREDSQKRPRYTPTSLGAGWLAVASEVERRARIVEGASGPFRIRRPVVKRVTLENIVDFYNGHRTLSPILHTFARHQVEDWLGVVLWRRGATQAYTAIEGLMGELVNSIQNLFTYTEYMGQKETP